MAAILDGADRRAAPEPVRVEGRLLGRSGFTREAAAFTRDDVICAWAAELAQGAQREDLEALADATLARAEVVALVVADGEGRPLTTEHPRGPGPVVRLVRAPASGTGTLVAERRYTTAELLATEACLVDTALAGRDLGAGRVPGAVVDSVLTARPHLSGEQVAMVRSLCGSGDLVETVVGVPGSGKTFALESAQAAWRAAGYRVTGAALAAQAAAQRPQPQISQ